MSLDAEVAEQADATVSKTVEGRPSCGFESHLRHSSLYQLLRSIATTQM